MHTDWAALLRMPTEEIIRERRETIAEEGAGILWSVDPEETRELSALGALAWEGREEKPTGSDYEWVGFNLLCNAAPTPFTLGGEPFSSVDSFHEALKFAAGSQERTLCAMAPALEARKLARRKRGGSFPYGGQVIAVGSTDHEALLAAAISAKVSQNSSVGMALRETGTTRLVFPLTYTERPGPLGRITPLTLMIERWKDSASPWK